MKSRLARESLFETLYAGSLSQADAGRKKKGTSESEVCDYYRSVYKVQRHRFDVQVMGCRLFGSGLVFMLCRAPN